MASLTRNTSFLVARTALSVAIGLVTSRLVLQALGIESYGLFAAIASLVALCDFVNASISGASSRFMAYELGRNDKANIRAVVSSSLRIQLYVAAVLVFIAETIGLWYISNHLNTGDSAQSTVMFVYQMLVLSALASVLRTPAVSWLIARERMGTYASMEIFTAVLRLSIVIGLINGLAGGHICGYAALIAGVSIVTSLAYCTVMYRDLKSYITGGYSKSEIRNHNEDTPQHNNGIIRFSLLDLVGNMSVIFNTQGIVLAINATIGLAANAALALANAVQNPILTLVSSVTIALRPRVIKLYATEAWVDLQSLLIKASRIASLFYLAIIIPLIFNAKYILRLWLDKVSEGTSETMSVLLVVNIFAVFTNVFITAIHASGRIVGLSFGTGVIYLCGPFAVYALCRMGYGAADALCILAPLYASIMIVALYIASRALPSRLFGCMIKTTILPILILGVIVATITYYANVLLPSGIIALICDTLISLVIFSKAIQLCKRT